MQIFVQPQKGYTEEEVIKTLAANGMPVVAKGPHSLVAEISHQGHVNAMTFLRGGARILNFTTTEALRELPPAPVAETEIEMEGK